jgi:GntR family transcriptional regulator, transcriptional repressor for pyruvate dehydrogenase complex
VTVADIVQHIVTSTAAVGMRPGDRFPPERQLVEQIGIGRSPLREALKCLDILGFIEIRQGDGTFLSTVSANLLPRVVSWGLLLGTHHAEELIELRRFMEPILARLASDRRTTEQATQIQELANALNSASTAAEFAEADRQFHFAIANAANNSAFAATLESIKSLLDAWILQVVTTTDDWSPLITDHIEIANAIRAGDAVLAELAMRNHLDNVYSRLQASLAGQSPVVD